MLEVNSARAMPRMRFTSLVMPMIATGAMTSANTDMIGAW